MLQGAMTQPWDYACMDARTGSCGKDHACIPSVLLTAVPPTRSYPTPGLLMDIPSVKTGQQLYKTLLQSTLIQKYKYHIYSPLSTTQPIGQKYSCRTQAGIPRRGQQRNRGMEARMRMDGCIHRSRSGSGSGRSPDHSSRVIRPFMPSRRIAASVATARG